MSSLTILALILIFLGGVGAILLAISQNFNSTKDKQEIINLTKAKNDELQVHLVEIKRERDSLKSDLDMRDKRIQEQTGTIIELNQKLVEKSDYISDHLIGGKGYPFITTNAIKQVAQNQQELTTFTINNETNLPLYDIAINIFDWNYLQDKIFNNLVGSLPNLSKTDFTKSILFTEEESYISPKSNIITSKEFDLRNCLLYIKLISRSSFVFEKMAFVTENHKIYQGFIVYDEAGKILKEWMSPNATETAKATINEKFKLIPLKVQFNLTQ